MNYLLFASLAILFAYASAEPAKTHSQIMDKTAKDLFIAWNKDLAAQSGTGLQGQLDQITTMFQTLNVADMSAMEFVKQHCVPNGLIEPSTDKTLCVNYPPLVYKQIQSRLAAVFSRFLKNQSKFRLSTTWLRHSEFVLNRLTTLDSANAGEYEAFLRIVKGLGPVVQGKLSSSGPTPENTINQMTQNEVQFSNGMSGMNEIVNDSTSETVQHQSQGQNQPIQPPNNQVMPTQQQLQDFDQQMRPFGFQIHPTVNQQMTRPIPNSTSAPAPLQNYAQVPLPPALNCTSSPHQQMVSLSQPALSSAPLPLQPKVNGAHGAREIVLLL